MVRFYLSGLSVLLVGAGWAMMKRSRSGDSDDGADVKRIHMEEEEDEEEGM